MVFKRLSWLLAVMAVGALVSPALALPNEFVQEGLVLDQEGFPMEGRHDIQVRLYPVALNGQALFDELHEGVEFFEGYYSVAVGSINELEPTLFARDEIFMGLSIDGGDELTPRVRMRKVPAAMVADVALSVVGDIDVTSVAIGGAPVIDAQGRWVGDPTGLRGPQGPAGPQGPQGDRGPEGPAGPGGNNADPQEVVPLVVRELQANPNALPFIRKNANDSTNGTVTFDGGKIVMRSGGTANSLDLGNNNIVGANALRFNDPGPNEGIIWDGTQAKIVVSGLANQNADGWLRIINDGGISLENTVRIGGDLSIGGVISEVQRITATVITATTANITNANITNLNGPNGRVNVAGSLNMTGDIIIGPATDFQGTIRTGGVVSAGDIQGRNINATGSVAAAGHVTAGANGGRVVAGSGGIWVRDVQVFDGNGNLLRRPVYQCPVGRLFFGTDANGAPRCVNVTCPVGQAFRGFDAALNPLCERDDGITAIPANSCPDGQAVVAIDAQGRTTCGAPRAEPLECEEGEFMVGIDEDGSVICAEAPEGGGGGGAAGQCAADQVRPKIMYCGATSRNVQTFIPQGYNFQVVASCNPDDQTQVMFVSRRDGNNAAGRAAQWQAYLRAGGQIVTEYSISHNVFNAVFGTNVPRGTRRGSCRDNAMPVVKLNPEDAFWQEFNLNVTPANESACGYEVTNFPEITPLGGWAANQINFGYRDLGEGRLWLLDADWQDNQNWRAESTQLMQGLATWCMAGQDEEEAGELFEFNGVRNNVNDADLEGWERCHLSQYGDRNISIAQIQQACGRGEKILYGCRPTGSNVWRVMAQGDRAAVFRDTGNGNATTRNNGVEWYFSTGRSLGFAPEGQAVSRNSCDTTSTGNNDRICWHSSGGNMNGGWRCGNQTGLNGAQNWERAIWYSDPEAGGGDDDEEPGNRFSFEGVRQNTADALLEGWEPCHTSRYGATTNNLQQELDANCDGDHIMYGCRPVGSNTWTLLAQGERAQVFRDTGNGNVTTRHNGVEWYFNTSHSIGFAPQGEPVSRNSCDTQNGQRDLRMCWHSSGNRMTSGYRCGGNFLNGNNNWERRIWTSSGAAGGGRDDVYASCKQARAAGNRENGVYRLRPPGEQERRVWCDMTTDGGGWTLVGSTRTTTFNDQRSNYYDDLQRLDPAAGHDGIWWGLRSAPGGRFDVRFACRDAIRGAGDPMTVDLSVYDVNWYMEWTTGSDAQSCFSESNGGGDDNPPPMRRNNLNNQVRNRGDQWNAGYLEGEDSCGDSGDFTVDFDDRGMDSNQSDGTDWGEDDSSRKCGRSGLGSGQWFIYARERGEFEGGGDGEGGGEGIALNPDRAFGHHGSCNTWNGCNNAQTCANWGCRNDGHGDAISFDEGRCQDLDRGARPNIDCNLFRNQNDLDDGWGNGCNIPVAYNVVCEPALAR